MKTILQAMAFCVLSAGGVQAQNAEIKDTIDSQIEAFKVDDFTTAFTFASPGLQSYFQTPQNFGRMVSQGYPMVWRPAGVQYLELREEADVYWQKLQITDKKGQFHVLEYRMLQTPDGWRINGVQILDAPGAAV